MKEKIKIGGKEITFTANGATPMKFRNEFGYDLMEKTMEGMDYETVEKLAYIMSGSDAEITDWLGQFEMSVYNDFEKIVMLWTKSLESTSEPPKNHKAADQ